MKRRLSRQESAIPSQQQRYAKPYSPSRQPDIGQFDDMRGDYPYGTTLVESFVVPTYDSRPINCYDFLKGDEIQEPFNPQKASWKYVVPPGRVAILRAWYLQAATLEDVEGATINQFYNPDGSTLSTTRLDFLIDGSGVPEFSGIVTRQILLNGGMRGDAFLIVGENQTLEMRIITGEALFVEGSVTGSLSGNLLLASGGAIAYEIGSSNPVPVKTGGV